MQSNSRELVRIKMALDELRISLMAIANMEAGELSRMPRGMPRMTKKDQVKSLIDAAIKIQEAEALIFQDFGRE